MEDKELIGDITECFRKVDCEEKGFILHHIASLIHKRELMARIDELKAYTDYVYTSNTAQRNAIERVKQLKAQLTQETK